MALYESDFLSVQSRFRSPMIIISYLCKFTKDFKFNFSFNIFTQISAIPRGGLYPFTMIIFLAFLPVMTINCASKLLSEVFKHNIIICNTVSDVHTDTTTRPNMAQLIPLLSIMSY